MYRKLSALLFIGALLGSVLVSQALADQDNQEITFTTKQPVEIPGRVLSAGRYELRMNGDGSNVAQLWNSTGTRFYGYFPTIPFDRAHARQGAKVALEAGARGAPERIKGRFYASDKQGNEFLYPAGNHQASTASPGSPGN